MPKPPSASGVRVLYQRYSSANRAFSYIDSGYANGWRSLGATISEWLDEEGQPTLGEQIESFRPTHFLGNLQTPRREPCRWLCDPASLAALGQRRSEHDLFVAARSDPSNIRDFADRSEINFARFNDAGVSSYYTQPDRPNDAESRLFDLDIVDLIRSPLSRHCYPVCFRNFLSLGLRILEEPFAADSVRYQPEPSHLGEGAIDVLYIGGCWKFKWRNMAPYIHSLREEFGDGFAVYGEGWPAGVSRGALRDDQFCAAVARSRVSIALHEPTQVDGRPFAHNERVFKLLALGATVVSDNNPALRELFEPDREIELASSPDDMLDRVRALLANPVRARSLAAAGRRRVLTEHTYAARAARLLAISSDQTLATQPIIPYQTTESMAAVAS